MTSQAATLESHWLKKARALEPIVTKYSDEAERERRLPNPVLQAVRESGFLTMLLPRSLGGEQVDVEVCLQVFEELARQDGSIGWNAMFAMVGPLFSDYFSESTAREVFGGRDTIMVGSFAPSGQAEPVEGGYKVNGKWGFGSCCLDADWLVCGAVILEDGHPKLGGDGLPEARIFCLPSAQYEILDTWYTMGMRGTGSHDFSASNAFVPETQSFPRGLLAAGPIRRPGTGYGRPFFEFASMFLATTALGIARHAIDAFAALAATKTATGATSPLSTQQLVQDKVGRAEALVGAGRAYLIETARRVKTAEGAPPLIPQTRLAAAHAAQNARAAVDLVYEAGGGSSIYQKSPLERCFRDIHTVTHHFIISTSAFVDVGKGLLNPQV